MLNIGFFTDSTRSIDSYKLTDNNGLYKVSGVCSLEPQNNPVDTGYSVFEQPEKLLPIIDLAVVDLASDKQATFAPIAIKSGVDVFIANSQELTLPTLSQLDMLSHEIGIKLGFGQLGYILGLDHLHIEQPIIAEIRRSATIASTQHFDSILKFDIATALTLTKNKIRKIRAYSVPNKSPIPSTLFALIDFDNSSAITYTLSGTEGNSAFHAKIHHSDKTLHFEIPDPDRMDYKELDFNNFVTYCSNNTEPEQGVELASNTVFVTETIYSKIG